MLNFLVATMHANFSRLSILAKNQRKIIHGAF